MREATEMQGKNSGSGLQCTKKFCAVNSDYDAALVPAKIVPPSNLPADKELTNDPGMIQRNRELRRMKDALEAARQDEIRNRYQKNTVTGPNEIAKLRLILTIQKYQSLAIDYAMISQYFADCIKPLDLGGDGNIDTIKEILIYDRDALKNSATCYASALAGIQKCRPGTFSPIGDIVNGLADALRGLGN